MSNCDPTEALDKMNSQRGTQDFSQEGGLNVEMIKQKGGEGGGAGRQALTTLCNFLASAGGFLPL